MKSITTLWAILLLTISAIHSQKYEPLDLAKKIFSKDSLANMEHYITKEYKGSPNGQDIQKGANTKFMLLKQTENIAVVSMTIIDSLGKGLDTYLHFEKDSSWKMCAFRALAMTGIIEQMKMELEIMTPKQVDDFIAQSKKKKKKDYAMFASREDYQFLLGNSKLILELDENIAKHFIENQSAFERLKNLALTELEKEKAEEERSIKLIENAKADYQKLFISSVSSGGYELGKCINFLIGGMLDNMVGYLYVKDKKDLPEMNPSNIIMIKEIGNGWYVYKTT